MSTRSTATLHLKRQLGRLSRQLGGAKARKMVLAYHSIGDRQGATGPQIFAAQMRILERRGDNSTLSEVVSGRTPSATAVTFDDGYASLAHTARSAVADCGIRPCVFLTTGWIDQRTPRASRPDLGHYSGETFLTWPDVETLRCDGWEFGAHGVDHLDLTSQNQTIVDHELTRSKAEVEQRLGGTCRAFAYTWGRHTAELRARVQAAGFQYAMSTRHGPIEPTSDHLALPRIDIHPSYTVDDFRAILDGDWDYLGWLQSARLAVRVNRSKGMVRKGGVEAA